MKNSQLTIVLLLLSLIAKEVLTQSSSITCELGQYLCSSSSSSSSSSSDFCVPCSAGFSNKYYTTYQQNTCSWCQAGYYANKTSSYQCQLCPEGTYCIDPSISPVPCPLGTAFSSILAGFGSADYGVSQCTKCPAGYYANKLGSTTCTPCPAGYYCPIPTSGPIQCPKGTYGEHNFYGGFSNPRTCQACPLGTYAAALGSTKCTTCPDGYECSDPTQAPVKCPLGSYRNNFVTYVTFPYTQQTPYYTYMATNCLRCPQGYYANVTGSSICKKCPKGYYCADPRIGPKPCPPGTYSKSEYGTQTCTVCDDGSYATTSGSIQCTICPKGYYCADMTQPPVKCPLGTYANSPVGQGLCAACPSNTYANSTGTINCTPCPTSMCCNDPTIGPTKC